MYRWLITAIFLPFSVVFSLMGCSQPWEKSDRPFDRNDLPVKISKLKGGIYLAEDFNYWKSNSLFYVHKDGIVFLDSGWTYKSARQIIWKASTLGYGDFIAIVPTSYHLNRTSGLSAFRGTGIRVLMQRQTPRMIYQDWERLQKRMRSDFGSWRSLPAEGPNALFTNEFSFLQGRVMLYHFGPGLSPDNVVVHFPEERVVYAGNLLAHPLRFYDRVNTQGLLNNLKQIEELDFDTIIAGHGKAIHKRAFLSDVRQALEDLE